MEPSKTHTISLQNETDIVKARQLVRQLSTEVNFSLVDQTKLVTAASELARNTVIHGDGGTMRVDVYSGLPRTGLRLTFEDQGPGIPDVQRALQDGFTTGVGLG